MTEATAADRLRAAVQPDGGHPVAYLHEALFQLSSAGLGWLFSAVPCDPTILRATLDALYGADGQHLDRDDAYPHVILWCLRVNNLLRPDPDLDQQLINWRAATEAEHGETFQWLPSFPENSTLTVMMGPR